jgi:hypothetical protein
MYNPGHSLTVTYQSAYNADTNSLSSSFIPGNRDYYASDTRDSDFYSDLEDACDALRP